jgi:uncharacterized protein (TIGR03435 family)
MKYSISAFILAASVAYSQTNPSFEVASIKPSSSADQRPLFSIRPDQVRIENASVKRLIELAYGIKNYQVAGGPGWTSTELYSINAKPESSSKPDQIMPMLQLLLAERSNLSSGAKSKRCRCMRWSSQRMELS